MTLELTNDEALVLFDWLARLDGQDALPVEDAAEETVLWSLLAQLEKVLVEPFRPDYDDRVERARARLKPPFGEG